MPVLSGQRQNDGRSKEIEMSEVARFLQRFPDFPVTPGQLGWAKYLEQEGLRFLVDFGFENAEEIADEWMDFTGRTQAVQ